MNIQKKHKKKGDNVKLHTEFKKYLIESETDLEELLKHYGVKDSTELNENQFNEAIAIMKKKVNKKEVF